MAISLPENFKIVDATAGAVTTNGGVTGAYVSVKNIIRAWLLISLTEAVGFAEVLSIKQATAVAGTGVKTGPTCNIWSNEDTAASDTLVKQTAATSYTTTNDVKKKQVLFEIDVAALDQANSFDCLGFTASDSSQATNFISAVWILETSYKQATPPSATSN